MTQAEGLLKATPALRGPKGARTGDLILAERSTWRVVATDVDRHEVVTRLTCGSHVLRRFRARRIERVWRPGHEPSEGAG